MIPEIGIMITEIGIMIKQKIRKKNRPVLMLMQEEGEM